MVFGSHSEQLGMDFGISVLLRPEIERDRGKFVDKRADEPGVRSMDLM
jgi:hypothetical protein